MLVITPAFTVASSVRRRLGALPDVAVDVVAPGDGADVASAVRGRMAVILCPYVPAATYATVRAAVAGCGERPCLLEMAEGPELHALVLRTEGGAAAVAARERSLVARLAAALDLPLDVPPLAWESAGRTA